MLKNHDKIFPKIAFNIRSWKKNLNFWKGQDNDGYFANEKDLQKAFKCRYAACAIGSACHYPPFKKLGLKMKVDMPSYKKEENWYAVTAFFGITEREAYRAFNMDEYDFRPSADDVAKRVDKLITKYTKKAN